MTDAPADQVEAVARALFAVGAKHTRIVSFPWEGQEASDQEEWREMARVAISMIERATAEKCAEIAEDHAGDVSSGAVGRIAAAIRRSFPGGEK